MDNVICNSIRSKARLKFIYDSGYRIVEPHAYGIDSKGDEKLRAFQVEGESSSGTHGWKLFDANKILSLEVLDEHFNETRPRYNPNGDRHIPRIICMI